jgi:hypothetical protein
VALILPGGEGSRSIRRQADNGPGVTFFWKREFRRRENRYEDRLRSWCPTTCLQASPRTPCRSPISFRIEGDEADPQGPDHGSGYNVATDSRSTCMHVNVI